MKNLFSQITRSVAKYAGSVKMKPLVVFFAVCAAFVVVPSYSNAKVPSGLYAYTDEVSCKPCKLAASVINASGATKVLPSSAQGGELGALLGKDTRTPTVATIDSNGEVVEKAIVDNNSAKKIEDMKKRLADKEKSLQTKFEKDRCWLIPPGMSLEVGRMYGEIGVRAFNDKNIFRSAEIVPCQVDYFKEDLPKIRPLFAATDNDFPVITKTLGLLVCPVWAVDYANNEAKATEDESNHQIRVKEKAESDDTKKYTVTMDTDLTAITGTKANEDIRPKSPDENCKKKSNETCVRVTAENQAKKENGEAIPALGKGKAPSKPQHEEYWKDDNHTITLAPPPTQGIILSPATWHVGFKDHPTGYSFKSSKQPSVGTPEKPATGNAADLLVKTDEGKTSCTYEKSKAVSGTVPNGAPDAWDPSDLGSQGGNPSGSAAAAEALNKLLPALMQALQGLGKGNQNPTPSPSATPYACPTPATNEQVCGTNGATYASRCLAEYKNQTTVKHTGVCTSSDPTSTTDTVSTISSLLNQLTSSGIPDRMIRTVTQAIINLLTGTLSIGNTASHTTVQ